MHSAMTQLNRTLYTAKTHTTGGRDGSSRSADGRLDVRLSPPGTSAIGANPEQLFAAGWSACFIGAIKLAAGRKNIALPPDVAIDTEVDLCLSDDGFSLQARLNVVLPGMELRTAQDLVQAAHETCPYSKATRGNINVALNVRTTELIHSASESNQ